GGGERALDAGTTIDATMRGALVTTGAAGIAASMLLVEATDSGTPLRLNGRDYSGVLELRRGDSGLVVVNRVSLEEYLIGVVSAELGQRGPNEVAALKAQAVASRTYAIRNQGRWSARGFDLIADAGDQIYIGRDGNNALAAAAVRDTRGEVLMYDGQPIDAFFSSTCGGRTEDGSSAFLGADRPYLRAVDDRDPSGTPWCAISPRFHWTTGWSASALSATLRRTLAAEGLPGGRASDLTGIKVTRRTGTGRVASIELIGRRGVTEVSGQAVRRVLTSPDGPLRSTDFTVRISRHGGVLERVDIDGTGYGHGVGMCQWGAIGRARAGQDYQTILASYFPGTELRRIY
ncbi:MAG: SpoIID/LytB domain-containing protein, partial [Gemmatimonadales bacterium]